jgi:hypothetical protein
MKLDEFRTKVYELAQVSTTQHLKAKYAEIKTLDMRRKTSWEQALIIVQNQANEFQGWLEIPPSEYQELFAEIETVSEGYFQKLTKTKQLGQEVTSIAANLEVLAEECQAEADSLKQEVQGARRIKKQAELN